MFNKDIYIKRRDTLKKEFSNGIILFLGNKDIQRNYPSYKYQFRQNSSFIYFYGHNQPELDAIINIDDDEEILFGKNVTEDDIVWEGEQASLDEKASMCGVSKALETSEIVKYLEKHKDKKIHFLPPYRQGHFNKLFNYIGLDRSIAKNSYSLELIKAVARLRNKKDELEISEIKKAIDFTKKTYNHLIGLAKPGTNTKVLYSEMVRLATLNDIDFSFSPIISTGNKSLHALDKDYILKKGDLLLIDSGYEINSGYCSDITRTFPIGTKFSKKQEDIYSIVLDAQTNSIKSLKAGLKYIDTYVKAAKIIFDGLKDIGITKGNTQDAISVGAHGLFFCHGLGHLLGLDAHDLEDLGEDHIGYNENIKRSTVFGIKSQRYAKELEENYLITVEPGIYFMPALIKQWNKNKKFSEFINYELVLNEYMNFGGIRIEDDILITKNSCINLSKEIVKELSDINNLY